MYQWFKADRQKIKVSYDDCYFKCPAAQKEWDESRREYCEECPHRQAKEKCFTDAKAVFKERFDEPLPRSKFNELLDMVRNVAAFEGTEKDIGVKHSHLLSAYLGEKDKYDRATKK